MRSKTQSNYFSLESQLSGDRGAKSAYVWNTSITSDKWENKRFLLESTNRPLSGTERNCCFSLHHLVVLFDSANVSLVGKSIFQLKCVWWMQLEAGVIYIAAQIWQFSW